MKGCLTGAQQGGTSSGLVISLPRGPHTSDSQLARMHQPFGYSRCDVVNSELLSKRVAVESWGCVRGTQKGGATKGA